MTGKSGKNVQPQTKQVIETNMVVSLWWKCSYIVSLPVFLNEPSATSKKVRQTIITICSGLSHSTGWAAQPSKDISGPFFQGQRGPIGSDDITRRLFQMNMKGLTQKI
jgi:hypothetical protein